MARLPRSLNALATVVGCLLIGCSARLMPRVVTVVVPYVPILVMDTIREPGLMGAVRCDIGGMPYVLMKPGMSVGDAGFVLTHELIHVEQARAHRQGCRGLRAQMGRDSMFRLAMEADAFCGVYRAQQTIGLKPDPTLATIVETLRQRYHAAYDSAAVLRAMSCG